MSNPVSVSTEVLIFMYIIEIIFVLKYVPNKSGLLFLKNNIAEY